jgi:hypothetical protein
VVVAGAFIAVAIADTVIPVTIPAAVVAVAIARAIVPIAVPTAIVPVPAQIGAVAVAALLVFAEPALVVAQFSAVLADVAVAAVVVAVAKVAAQVGAVMLEALLVLAEPALVVAQFSAVLADIAEAVAVGASEAVAGIGAPLVQPARPLGHFVGAHALQPVDPVSEIRTPHPLVRPATDGLAQAIGEGRSGRCRGPAQAFQGLSEIYSGAEGAGRWIVGPNCFAACQGEDGEEVNVLHGRFPQRESRAGAAVAQGTDE